MATERLGLKEAVAMGIGGMVGGGIFSVLGLSVGLSGHAAPLAFLLGGTIALITGLSYAKLGLTFRSDGGSFTYLERAFRNRNVAGIGGWLLVAGYIGTMSLYAFTFAAYGTALFGQAQGSALNHGLEAGILLVFLGINLLGVRAAGRTEDIIVAVKVAILAVFGVAGLATLHSSAFTPLLDKGMSGLLMGAALIFVAYEGFELIPNAVKELGAPERNLPRAIIISVLITTAIYVLVSLVAVGNLTPDEIAKQKEYALAVAAQPFLGQVGFLLIGIGALLSTASAINATMFGTARLTTVMAVEEELPKVFSYRERTRDIPWVALWALTLVTIVFVLTANLTIISSFASATFLLIFAEVNLSAFRLRRQIGIHPAIPLLGMIAAAAAWVVLVIYLVRQSPSTLAYIGGSWAAIALAELMFSRRAPVKRPAT